MEAAPLDGLAVEMVLAVQAHPTCSDEAGGRQRASEVGPRALRAVENAAAGQRRSGAMLLSSNKEGVGGLAEARGTASTEPSTRAEGAARRHLAKESSGISSARAVGRLQKSVRGIFPASSAKLARVTLTASGSTDRPLLMTVEPERFGQQGCWVNER